MNLSSPAVVSAILKRHDLRPRRRFGQNFLIDANMLGKIVTAGGVGPGDQVLEIGAGLGVLTHALGETVTPEGRVVTVEIDRDLLPVLEETIGSLAQVNVVSADALSLDWPVFLREQFSEDKPVHTIANIPYNITTPLLTTMVENKDRICVIVLLVQKEVAQRLAAAPATSDYGSLSVYAQYHAKVEIIATVSRRVFLPAPDVDSAIVRLTPYTEPPIRAQDEPTFFAVVRAAFGQRRKALPNALTGDPALGWDRDKAAKALSAAGIDPQRRGETLSVAEFVKLADSGL
ncbi:ribosomal RNA small subunit methyltransferase A [Capsulimonas corticalis]|uniref:Ribosomal RNA small subunit methyltransferase A n=1 Tax=Capsulimonas corticalis TaxID=2219043 RepID=A0A402CT17_9BACT|nr:16S rRNA (adenine(1518)-N(6)/adenine(1519)-N(6))-dimethyltransferase RsmA [Capsulimonas corticalis]BDI30893.1 ribosomal RNA small subunit methyltransferase A [Capsulimonas corticalis]